jgi:hypothetical protein
MPYLHAKIKIKNVRSSYSAAAREIGNKGNVNHFSSCYIFAKYDNNIGLNVQDVSNTLYNRAAWHTDKTYDVTDFLFRCW